LHLLKQSHIGVLYKNRCLGANKKAYFVKSHRTGHFGKSYILLGSFNGGSG